MNTPEGYRCGHLAIVGRPNVGKSTLVNALVGEKISIVTPKPQTTRNRIYGIFNRGETQFVLLDTPGFHKARTRLGEYMVGVVRESVSGVDAVALLVEPIPSIGTQEKLLIDQIKASGVPAVLVINKIDTVKKEELLLVIDAYRQAHGFAAIVPISALKGDGIHALIDELEKFAVEGPPLFPEDMVTDQPIRQIIAEIVREKLLLCLEREVPHGTAVEVTRYIEREDGILELDITIYCEKDTHKSIIIGKNGQMLKKIGQMARQDIEAFLGTKVFMETWVKVKDKWRDNIAMIRNFGYKYDGSK